MGLAVIVEYATGLSLGIDTLFFSPWDITPSNAPGRMLLTTAVSFIVAGSALFIIAIRNQAYGMFGILNSVTLSLALTSLIAYTFHISTVFIFSLNLQMALNTSLAMFAYGLAMLHYAWKHAEYGADGLPNWYAGIGISLLPPLLVGVSALLPEQSWRVISLGALFATLGVGFITLAIRWLTTAKISYKGMLMIVMPLSLLLTFVSLVAHIKHESESMQTLTIHSTEVINTSQALVSQIIDTESSVRGYMITCDASFVEAYPATLQSIAQITQHLLNLVSDNPQQELSAQRVAQAAVERMDYLSYVIALIKTDNKKQIEREIVSRKGVDLMKKLRAEVASFSQEELRLGTARRQALETSWQRLSWLLVSGTTAAILLSSILALSFSGSLSKRLQQLRNNANNLATGKALAAPLTGSDEIAELDQVFHDMADSLNQAAKRENTERILDWHTIDVRHTEALLKAGALQNAIFNSANFSSIATDAKGVIQIFNVGAERMLGYTAADVVNTITPADISDPQEVIIRAEALSLELGTTITPGFEALVFKASRGIEDIYELTYIRKDGSRFPAVVSVTALRDPQDAIIGYLLIGTDNTARKQAEEALLKAGALQNAIFNSANFSSIATDARGVIQIFNVGAERMLGYTAAEVVNTITPADISDPQEVIARAEALSLELATTITPGFEALVFKASRGIEDIYELTYIRKDTSRFPAVVSVTALRDAQERIIGYLLIGTDNTARKLVEADRALLDQRLRDQQFYTRSLIESNIDALMMTDPQGVISDVNQQMIELTGRTRDELIGAPSKNFFTDPVKAEAAIKRVLTENKVSNYELTVRAQDGEETVVSYNAATFYDRERKLQGVFASARDVTERKRIDLALQEKNVELEHATRMKSVFLATMSHELRTPLNAIIGFSEALKDGLAGSMDETQLEYIGDIFSSGQHLLSLINDILDLSKVEAGMMTLELEPTDLNWLLSNSLTIVREKAAAHGISLELEIGDDLLLPDTALESELPQLDMRKTKQIVYNLLSNAVKFSAKGGHVALHAHRVARSAVGSMDGNWPVHGFALADNLEDNQQDSKYSEFLELSVSDNGIGISIENMSKLFQAFTQIDSSLARKFEGTGLGLAMVKQLVELHGGTVAVASEEGKGSHFAVWLPLRTAS
ncbi:hypothetical protein ZMTM_14560 [Methyloradius palustris]|uniref:histidine kinase n=2 Tax=Methyloradius palustris TaxID=2778876 RepID=A0A8D5JZ03_9PROT|nr:hypothetical protein ZMTM_14560 [Methyloradius palustris]